MRDLQDITEDLCRVYVMLGKMEETEENIKLLNIIEEDAESMCKHMGLNFSFMTKKYWKKA